MTDSYSSNSEPIITKRKPIPRHIKLVFKLGQVKFLADYVILRVTPYQLYRAVIRQILS
jgi:hypothetical protein